MQRGATFSFSEKKTTKKKLITLPPIFSASKDSKETYSISDSHKFSDDENEQSNCQNPIGDSAYHKLLNIKPFSSQPFSSKPNNDVQPAEGTMLKQLITAIESNERAIKEL